MENVKILSNGATKVTDSVEKDFREAQSLFDMNSYLDSYYVDEIYNNRVGAEDFVGSYQFKVDRTNDYREFCLVMTNHITDYKNKVGYKIRTVGQNMWSKGLYPEHYDYMTIGDHLDEKCSEAFSLDKNVEKMEKAAEKVNFEAWRSGRLSNGQRLGRFLNRAGFGEKVLDFYSRQIKTERELVLTISDTPQHIAGMSYYCPLDLWDGYKGSSCQDVRHEDNYVIHLLGALHDNRLFVGMLHESVDELQDFEDKMLARTVMRLVELNGKNYLVATDYYGNNETKDLLNHGLNELAEFNILGHKYHGWERVETEANDFYESLVYDEVHVYEEFEEYVWVTCPMCGGSGDYNISTWEHEYETSCPACGGSGETDTSVYVHVDEWIEVEKYSNIEPYAEGYSHMGGYTVIHLDTEAISKIGQ